MGRLLKRVPLDFDWPINQTWRGYINPYQSFDCKACKGRGWSPEYLKLNDRWYGFDGKGEGWNHNITKEDIQALIENDRLYDFTRIPLNEEQSKDLINGRGWLPYNNGYTPTPEEVNEWSYKFFGHDGFNAMIVLEARCKREGIPVHCSRCNGEGCFWTSPEIEKLHNDWEDFEPPTGDGFQLWENTSEGSPISPVFETLNRLCLWAEENETTFGSSKATAKEWHEMLDDKQIHHQSGSNFFF